MDRSSLMGLAMLVPIIGLSQGHSNGKTIKTIPNVPLNTNKVFSGHQELKFNSFSLHASLAWSPILSFQTRQLRNQTRTSILKRSNYSKDFKTLQIKREKKTRNSAKKQASIETSLCISATFSNNSLTVSNWMISWKLEALSSSPSSPQHHHISDRWGGVTSFLFIHHSASHRCHNISPCAAHIFCLLEFFPPHKRK